MSKEFVNLSLTHDEAAPAANRGCRRHPELAAMISRPGPWRFVVATLLACSAPAPARPSESGASVPPADGSIAGTVRYRLVGVNTVSLPDSTGCGGPIATGGALTLRKDGRWMASETSQYDCAAPPAISGDSGTFAWRGDTLTLISIVDPASTGTGVRRGDTLFVDFGLDAVYRYLRRP